jgi:hypothetical protein
MRPLKGYPGASMSCLSIVVDDMYPLQPRTALCRANP